MATTTNFGWDTPDDTDLVKDGAAAIRTLGNSIDTSFVDLKGGTTGQILSKASNTDLDYTWVDANPGDITEVAAGTGISGGGTTGAVTITNSMATAIDAKGDLIAGTGADTFARLAVGTNGQVLTAASGETTGLQWATPTSGSLTQLATGSLSGTSLVLSGFSSGYTDLVLKIYNAYASAINTTDNIQVNSISDYWRTLIKSNSTSVTNDSGQLRVSSGMTVPSTGETYFEYTFSNYSSTIFRKPIFSNVFFAVNGQNGFGFAYPNLTNSTAITSITFTLTNAGTAQTLSSGTYILYGRK